MHMVYSSDLNMHKCRSAKEMSKWNFFVNVAIGIKVLEHTTLSASTYIYGGAVETSLFCFSNHSGPVKTFKYRKEM